MAMLAIALFALGSIVGSFLNVVVLRYGTRSLGGRSSCLSCSATIRWYDNVPMLSWLALRGRCRSCGSAISLQYPLVEALTGALYAAALPPLIRASELVAGDFALLALHGAAIALLVAIAVYDAKHTIIPDAWAYLFAMAALAISLATSFAPPYLTLLAGPAAALPLFALWAVSGGRWMGLGDSKLALGIGWFLGPLYGFLSVFGAFIIGALVSVCILMPLPHIRRAVHRAGIARWRGARSSFTMKSEVAFGPFLIASFFIVWLSLLYNIPLPV